MSLIIEKNTQRKPRVLMLTWEYPPRLVGGLARAVCCLSRQLVALGCEVHVVTSTYPGAPKQSFDEGVHVHWLDHEHLSDGQAFAIPEDGRFLIWLARLNAAMVKETLRLHAKKPFDVIHAHDWLVTDAAQILTHLNIAMVTSIHATEFGVQHGNMTLYADSLLKDQLNQELLRISQAVIVNSQSMFEEVTSHFGTPAGLVHIVANGVDVDKIGCSTPLSALRQKHQLGDDNVVLYVGRFVVEKGVQDLLQAVSAVLSAHPNTRFVIAGHGHMEADLKQQAVDLKVSDRVVFFGRANDQDLSELYKLARMLVVPSRYEPFGLVALEGMAAHLPVVASKTGGLQDFVLDKKTGFTFPPGDVHALARKISFVLENGPAAIEVAEAGYASVLKNYSWRTSAASTLALYQSVLHTD